MSINLALDQLATAVLQKKTFRDCSVQELESLSNDYPYFAPLSLLKAAKLQDLKSLDFDKQLQHTSLYFPNPLLLDIILFGKGEGDVEKNEIENHEPVLEHSIPEEEEMTSEMPTIHSPAPERGALHGSETNRPELPERDNVPSISQEFTEEKIESIKEEENENFFVSSIYRDRDEPMQIVSPPADPATDDKSEEHSANVAVADHPPVTEIPLKEEKLDLTPAPTQSIVPQASTQNQAPLVAEHIFEPFHTVDYFASQGIKFREEEKPTDKFGKQLKSFTEWLKTLKKNTADPTVVVEAGSQAEHKVEQLAEKSLTDREVLTEAMAEVWEKQGRKEKARAIYEKLSLINPSKSSYFAAKIETLKQS